MEFLLCLNEPFVFTIFLLGHAKCQLGYRKPAANFGIVCAVDKYYLSKQTTDEFNRENDDPLNCVTTGQSSFVCPFLHVPRIQKLTVNFTRNGFLRESGQRSH